MADFGIVVDAACNPAFARTEEPTATAKNTKIAVSRALWIIVWAYAIVLTVIPVVAPLPDIAYHIIQAITVRRETTHRSRIRNNVIIVRMIALGWAYII